MVFWAIIGCLKIKTDRFVKPRPAIWEDAVIVKEFTTPKRVVNGEEVKIIHEKKLHIRFTGPFRSRHPKHEFRGSWTTLTKHRITWVY